MERLTALLTEWYDLRMEVRQYTASLDFWIVVILVLLLTTIAASRFYQTRDAIMVAAIIGSVGMVWIGRIDVLIHRPVPAIKQIESQIDQVLASLPTEAKTEVTSIRFLGWESHYKKQIKTGVKILIPLDIIAGLLIFALFIHANNAACTYLNGMWWRGDYFWWGALLVHFLGWAIIAGAKRLAE